MSGIGYSLWLRGRGALAAAFSLIVALAIFAKLVPVLRVPFVFGAAVKVSLPAVVFLAPVVLVPVLALLDVFTYGPIDLGTKASPFPLHARLLPLSTRALVGWPMLFAVVTVASVWLALLVLVLHPTGATGGTVWPTTAIVACTLWVQAISWVPLPARFLRMPLIFVFAGAPVALATVDPRAGDHFWALTAMMAAYAGAAVVTAIVGLSHARTGASWLSFGAARGRRRRASLSGSPEPVFASARAATRWYEARRNTSFVTRSFGAMSLPCIAYSALVLVRLDASFPVPIRSVHLPVPTLLAAIFLVVAPPLYSASMGGSLGRFDFWTRPGMSPFFDLRPVTTARMVMGKLLGTVSVAAAMLLCCLLVAGAGYCVYRASDPSSAPLSLSLGVDAVLVALAYGFLLWRNLVVDLWTTMLGSVWPARCSTAFTAVAFAGLPLAAAWLASDLALHAAVLRIAPFLVGALVAAKLLAASRVASALRARRLVSGRHLAVYGLGWCAVTAALVALAARYFPLSWISAAVVVLLVPITRVGLAPLALDAHRHGSRLPALGSFFQRVAA